MRLNEFNFGQQECQLQVDCENCLSMQAKSSQGDFLEMLEALGVFTSGLPKGDLNQYQVENALGFIGKYLFGESLLIELGYYKSTIYYGHGANQNYWYGTWTGKKRIDSKSIFLHSPNVQELIIRESFSLYWRRIGDILRRQGKFINDCLGQKITFDNCGATKTITFTIAGILAAAHLRGTYGVADLLLKNRVADDEFGTSILCYMDAYYKYEVKLEDFLDLSY